MNCLPLILETRTDIALRQFSYIFEPLVYHFLARSMVEVVVPYTGNGPD